MSDYHSSGPSAEESYPKLMGGEFHPRLMGEDPVPAIRQSVSPRTRSLNNPTLDHNTTIDTMQALEISEADKSHHTYKSFKKKFLKLRHGFDKRMGESTHTFEEEDRLAKVSRRLKEQNE